MSTINLSIGELLMRVYGEGAQPGTVKDIYGVREQFRKEDGKYGSPFYAKNLLGREYYMPIEVNVGHEPIPGTSITYADKLGVLNSQGAATGRWYLPHPVISAELAVNVIDTVLTERRGRVSQLINMDAYRIRVRGFIISKDNSFPEDDVETLDKLVKLGVPVRISCPFTDILLNEDGAEDRYVTLRRLRWPELPGVQGVRPYELDMMNEIPFNLEEV